MKLVVPCFGEVGIGSVVDVHPSRQWLGVTIPPFSAEFILVRPLTIRDPHPRALPERLYRIDRCSQSDSSLESCRCFGTIGGSPDGRC